MTCIQLNHQVVCQCEQEQFCYSEIFSWNPYSPPSHDTGDGLATRLQAGWLGFEPW